MVEPGFSKGQADNLPYVDEFMVANFIKNHDCYTSAEIRGVKSSKAAGEEYGDNAIGYVQIKKDARKCIVKGKITPEHNDGQKNYAVQVDIDVEKSLIENVTCADCAASEGACKHGIAFLMWVHRRCRDPASTETECYWKKSRLSEVGTSLKYIMAEKFNLPVPKQTETASSSSSINTQAPVTSPIVYVRFLEEARKKNVNAQILRHVNVAEECDINLSLHRLMSSYSGKEDCEEFLSYVRGKISSGILKQAAHDTRTQDKSPLWFELRYGRITASQAYEVAHCNTASSTLVEHIMGASQAPDTRYAMKRGRMLKEPVRAALEENMGITFIDSGFLICKEYPFIGASPDGVSEEYCLEIKCPMTTKTEQNYIKDNILNMKCYAQVQLQMFLAKRKKSIFCVASPDFVETETVTCMVVDIDEEYVENLIGMVFNFWKTNIFQHIYNSIKKI